MIERWTRNTFTTLDRAVTIDDPGTYTRPFTVHFTARLAVPDSGIMDPAPSRTISTDFRVP